MSETSGIRIAAAVLRNKDGQMLLVRKRGTEAFMQPGGKIESDEAPEVALSRELHEELGLAIEPDLFHYLDRYRAAAANEPGRMVEAEIYLGPPVSVDPVAGAEIEALVWVGPNVPPDLVLAPLTRDEILPRYL